MSKLNSIPHIDDFIAHTLTNGITWERVEQEMYDLIIPLIDGHIRNYLYDCLADGMNMLFQVELSLFITSYEQ